MTKGGKPIKDSAKNTSLMPFICLCIAIAATIGAIMFATFIIALNYISSVTRTQYNSLREVAYKLEEDAPFLSGFDEEMSKINSDYLCWIKIDGTMIDYPVVQGDDNEKYLNLSFYGEDSILGTLFMDYRCKGNYVPHIIIYGHNSKYGDMFGGLRHFIDGQYLNEHSTITLKVNGRISQYDIFSARKTDVNDPAYNLDFTYPGSFSSFAEKCGAPSGAAQIIALSTCVSGDDKDERVIVQGVLR